MPSSRIQLIWSSISLGWWEPDAEQRQKQQSSLGPRSRRQRSRAAPEVLCLPQLASTSQMQLCDSSLLTLPLGTATANWHELIEMHLANHHQLEFNNGGLYLATFSFSNISYFSVLHCYVKYDAPLCIRDTIFHYEIFLNRYEISSLLNAVIFIKCSVSSTIKHCNKSRQLEWNYIIMKSE